MTLGFGKIGDAKLLAAIHQSAFAGEPSKPYSVEQMHESLRAPSNYAIRNGEVGFLLFQLVGDECEIITLAVLPQFQQKGLARELMIELIGVCKAMNVKKIFLEVSVNNEKAINLYKKFTFVEYNRRSKYYADGSDAVLLQLLIE